MHAVTNVCMNHIFKVIYDISVDLVIFDLGLPLKVKSRLQTFKELCLINGASYDQEVMTLPIAKSAVPNDDIKIMKSLVCQHALLVCWYHFDVSSTFWVFL